ncbi:hypothetical protein SUGI_0396530 [Cryptomeria japonica]|nr:hypothetical protein SUGI_0396530 [Cryptomeria japonica]
MARREVWKEERARIKAFGENAWEVFRCAVFNENMAPFRRLIESKKGRSCCRTRAEGIGRMHTVEYKIKNVPMLQRNDYQNPSTTSISASLTSITNESGLNISGIKRLGDINAIVNSSSLTGSAINFGSSNELG